MKNSKKHSIRIIMKSGLLTVLAAGLLLLQGCKGDKDTGKGEEREKEQQQIPRLPVPAFNADSSYQYVKAQVGFGPRVPNTPAHERCGDYLISTLKRLGWEVKVQSFEATAFDGTRLRLRNIMASVNPSASQRILLAAHWDTRPFADQDSVDQKKPIDGANDGGSGVGVLLEMARAISAAGQKPREGIDIMLFDGEDYGAPEYFEGNHNDTYCLGSQYWARNKGNYSAYFGILLDMVGAKNARFAKEGVSTEYAPAVVNMVWNTAAALGYGNIFINQPSGPITDDHTYVNTIAHIPMIDIIEYNPEGNVYFGEYWHTHKDNLNVIDPVTLKAVGHTLLEVVYNSYKQLP